MITESVIFPSKPLEEGASMENPPPAILNFVLFVDMLTTCMYIAQGLRVIIFCCWKITSTKSNRYIFPEKKQIVRS
jgi:hypothetical protein